jgi:hypothetical protein
MLSGLGLTQEQIAHVKDICVDTLRKYANQAYHKGKAKAVARVARTCFEMATSGKQPVMTMFYLKTQGGWRVTPSIPEGLLHLFKDEE